MRMPFFLPPELIFCEQAETPEQLLNILVERPLEDLIAFFEAGCQDETWTQDTGGAALRLLLEWLNREAYERRLPLAQAVSAATAAQAHYSVLKPFFSYDLTFVLESQEVPSSSLMFTSFSEGFRQIVRKKGSGKNTKKIYFSEMSSDRFHQFAEFIYTGTIQYLWRNEPGDILQLVKDASSWGAPLLEQHASYVYKRYIDSDNVLDLLKMSHQNKLTYLQEECCAFINDMEEGIECFPLPNQMLQVAISLITERGLETLTALSALAQEIIFKNNGADDERAKAFAASLKPLELLDLSRINQLQPGLLDALPSCVELRLDHCPWLNDDLLIRIIRSHKGMMRLSLRENQQLGYRSWAAISDIRNLFRLDLSRCSLSDDDLALIAVGVPFLKELSLENCTQFSDHGLKAIGDGCSQLTGISLAGCSQISIEALIAFIEKNRVLEWLDVRECQWIDNVSLPKILSMLPNLHKINISGCDITSSLLLSLREKFKNLFFQECL